MEWAEYRLVAKKGEGTFSEVLKAQCIKNGKYVAIKCMKNHFDSLDQVRHRKSTGCTLFLGSCVFALMLPHPGPQQSRCSGWLWCRPCAGSAQLADP